MKALSIVVVNWNAEAALAKCLESVERTVDFNEVEVIVVDNCSSDDSVAMVRECFPWVRLIDNRENVGFARANNQGIENSRGKQVMLLNPDTELSLGAVKRLIEASAAHPNAGAIGPKLVSADGTMQISCSPFPTLFREFWRMFLLDRLIPIALYDMKSWSQTKPRPVDVVQGACMLLQREALKDVGLLDEDFFIYSEEVDFCFRLRQSGWSVVWEPRAEVMHHGAQSTRQAASEMFIYLYQTKIHFIRKHRGPLAVEVYKAILFAASWVRLLLGPILRIESDHGEDITPTLTRNYQNLLQHLPNL